MERKGLGCGFADVHLEELGCGFADLPVHEQQHCLMLPLLKSMPMHEVLGCSA